MLLNERVEWVSSCLGGWFCRCTTVVKSGMTFCDDMKSSCCQIILVTEGGRHWWINNHCNYRAVTQVILYCRLESNERVLFSFLGFDLGISYDVKTMAS